MSSLSTASSLDDLLNNDLDIYPAKLTDHTANQPTPLDTAVEKANETSANTATAATPVAPVRKPRTIFNLLSSPNDDQEKSFSSKSPANKTESTSVATKRPQDGAEPVVMETEKSIVTTVESAPPEKRDTFDEELEEEDPPVEAKNPFHPLNRGDTLDRVQDYLLRNPIGVASIQEQDEIEFIDDQSQDDDDVELSSTAST